MGLAVDYFEQAKADVEALLLEPAGTKSLFASS